MDKVKIAFLIPVHKNPNQVNMFLKQLVLENDCHVYVHIDKKNYSLKDEIIIHPQIKILEKSFEIQWGDISSIDAILLMMKEAINSNVKYDYFFIRSGQDLIVNKGLSEYIKVHESEIFMDARHMENKYCFNINVKWPRFTRKLYDGFNIYRVLRLALIRLYVHGFNILPNRNKLPEYIKHYHGSSWFGIPYEVLEYILLFLEKNPWYYKAFSNSLTPDEWFFQTIIMNSPYASKVVNDNLLYIKSWENNHPRILKEENIEDIIRSGKFFARKFDSTVDNKVIEYFCKAIGV